MADKAAYNIYIKTKKEYLREKNIKAYPCLGSKY